MGTDTAAPALRHARRTDPRIGTALRWSAGLWVAVVASWTLLATGVPVEDLLRFSAYWTLGILFPGVIVYRALRGPRGMLIEELALGAATGITLELAFGVILGLAGQDALSRWWPLLVYGALVAVPRFRQAARLRRWDSRESPAQAWAMAAITTVVLVRLAKDFRGAPLPTQDSAINIDPWWHLSLVGELLKPGAPQIPQVAGEPLVYHWFSHLHMAVAGASSGVDLPTVVLRLWIVPVVLATIAAIVALARQASGIAWTGPLAVWLTLLAVEGGVLWGSGAVPARVIFLHSPSQTLTNLLVVAAGTGFIDAARRGLGGREWLWLVGLLFACTGAKPTALTALLGGTLLAAFGLLLAQRRLDRSMTTLSVILGLVLVFVMPLTSGSLSGKATLFASLESLSPFDQIAGDGGLLATSDGILLDSLDSPMAWLVGAMTLARIVVGHATTFVGMTALALPQTRRDGASWWLAGALLSGWAAFIVIDHPSRSQFYFLATTFVFGAVLTSWLAAHAVTAGRISRRDVIASLLYGVVIALIARSLPGWSGSGFQVGPLDSLWMPMSLALAALAAMVVLVVRRRRVPVTSLPVVGLVVMMLIGLTIPGASERVTSFFRAALVSEVAIDEESIDFLTAEEQEAALWLKANSQPTDVVATNAHCRPGQSYFPNCDARGFWLSALSERRVLLEGWGYTPEASAAWGVDGRPTAQQPAPWPDRFDLSQQAFASPTSDTLTELRARGVSWLVGVRGAGTVSPDLESLATKTFDNGDVAIYAVDPMGR